MGVKKLEEARKFVEKWTKIILMIALVFGSFEAGTVYLFSRLYGDILAVSLLVGLINFFIVALIGILGMILYGEVVLKLSRSLEKSDGSVDEMSLSDTRPSSE
jgi:hypothetical protein